jgi:hypothetical protein
MACHRSGTSHWRTKNMLRQVVEEVGTAIT